VTFRQLIFGCTALAAIEGRAEVLMQKSELVDSYIDYRSNQNTLLQGPPVSHIVPNFNTITFALAFEKRNTVVFARTSSDEIVPNTTESLTLSGYTVAPHLSVSLKNIGLGFSIENSSNKAAYSNYYLAQGPGYIQNTTVKASGLGFNLSTTPFARFFGKNKLAFILGAKTLDVHHQFTGFYTNAPGDLSKTRTARYNLLSFEAGVNLNLQLLKNISLVPWAHYNYTNTSSANGAYDKEEWLNQTYQDDVRLFWDSAPRTQYGLDIGINVYGLNVRIGSLLGALSSLDLQPSYVKDKTFTVSLSFDQSGG